MSRHLFHCHYHRCLIFLLVYFLHFHCFMSAFFGNTKLRRWKENSSNTSSGLCGSRASVEVMTLIIGLESKIIWKWRAKYDAQCTKPKYNQNPIPLYTWTPHRIFIYCIRPRMGKRIFKGLLAFSGTYTGNDTRSLYDLSQRKMK